MSPAEGSAIYNKYIIYRERDQMKQRRRFVTKPTSRMGFPTDQEVLCGGSREGAALGF